MTCKVQVPVVAVDANKYSRGKLTVIAGGKRYPGAAVLAARASQRMGAGYTEVVTDADAVDIVRLSSPSLVVRALDQWRPRELPESRDARPCAVCIGPGFSATDEEADLVARVLNRAQCPVLVDGGALPSLATKRALRRLSERSSSGRATVVTPHGGEADRLARSLGISVSSPEKRAAALALSLGALVVLKGPDTVICDGRTTQVMTEGTPALAKAGTGDVLAGMIGALLAQGHRPFDAAFTATTIHARAGALAADDLTEVSVTAEDVIEYVPRVLMAMRSPECGEMGKHE